MKEWRKRPRDHICRGVLEEQKRLVGLFHHSLVLRVNFCSPRLRQTRRRSASAGELKSPPPKLKHMCGGVVDPKCTPAHRWRERERETAPISRELCMAKESTHRTTILHTADSGQSCGVCTYAAKMRAKMKEWIKRP